MSSLLKKFNPSIERKFILIIAGVVWAVVGIMLCNLAVQWLSETSNPNALWLGFTGLVLSLLIFHFGFLKLVKQNSERILAHKDKLCIFAFQPWKSYCTILIMIAMGMVLRHSPLPRPYLSIIYIGFGFAMILSCIKYFWIYLRNQGKL